MALTQKILASGQLAASTAILYTVPASTKCLVKLIKIVNAEATATRTVNVQVVPSGGNTRFISPKAMSLAAGYMLVLDEVHTLGAADAIRGWADSAGIVDYIIFGVEET